MAEHPLSLFEQMTYVFQNEYGLPLVLASLVFGFILSFAVGANDSANSWGKSRKSFNGTNNFSWNWSLLGTPVGAGTVSLGVAFFLGSIMEMLGATYLSGKVHWFGAMCIFHGNVLRKAYKLCYKNRALSLVNWAL